MSIDLLAAAERVEAAYRAEVFERARRQGMRQAMSVLFGAGVAEPPVRPLQVSRVGTVCWNCGLLGAGERGCPRCGADVLARPVRAVVVPVSGPWQAVLGTAHRMYGEVGRTDTGRAR